MIDNCKKIMGIVIVIGITIYGTNLVRDFREVGDPRQSAESANSLQTGTTARFTFDDLLDAIEWVESKGDPAAIGDGGDAVGAYQIHKIYVDPDELIDGPCVECEYSPE